jgi:hypothetical protein
VCVLWFVLLVWQYMGICNYVFGLVCGFLEMV